VRPNHVTAYADRPPFIVSTDVDPAT
jgi:hypothetical protein